MGLGRSKSHWTLEGTCRSCGKRETSKGHDPCIADLPGVKHACCGHGKDNGYICFENGTVVRGIFSVMRNHEKHYRCTACGAVYEREHQCTN